MSQAGGISSSSGPIPPTVATDYVTDDTEPRSGMQGHAIPALNVLKLHGSSAIDDTDDGIITVANPDDGNEVDFVLTNRATLFDQTVDAETVFVLAYIPNEFTATTFKVLVVGYDSFNDEAIGGEELGLCVKTGAVPLIIGVNDTFDETSPGLMDSDWNVVIDPAEPTAISMEFVGVLGRTINWRARFEYITQGIGS